MVRIQLYLSPLNFYLKYRLRFIFFIMVVVKESRLLSAARSLFCSSLFHLKSVYFYLVMARFFAIAQIVGISQLLLKVKCGAD